MSGSSGKQFSIFRLKRLLYPVMIWPLHCSFWKFLLLFLTNSLQSNSYRPIHISCILRVGFKDFFFGRENGVRTVCNSNQDFLECPGSQIWALTQLLSSWNSLRASALNFNFEIGGFNSNTYTLGKCHTPWVGAAHLK